MRELGIPFEEHLEPLGESSVEQRERFSRFSPNGKVPCLHDGDLRSWDSLPSLEYLAERYPAVWPRDPAARAYASSSDAQLPPWAGPIKRPCRKY